MMVEVYHWFLMARLRLPPCSKHLLVTVNAHGGVVLSRQASGLPRD